MGTWYLYESDGTTQITSTTEENLVYTFPQNPGSSDITYKVKYVDNSGCIGELSGGIKQDGCTGCDPSEWGFSMSPTTTPAGDTIYQDQWVPVGFPQSSGGHKVWSFYIWKKVNGTWVKQWERDNNSFVIKLYGPNGEDLSGKLDTDVSRPSGTEISEMVPYLLDVLITDACDLRGQALTITISPEECEDAIGKITGHFGSTEAYTIVVQDTGGQPYDHKMEIGFMGYITDSVCPPTWLKMGDFTVNTGQTGGVTSGTGYLFIGLEVDYTAQQSDLWCHANETIDHLPSDKHPLIVASLANTGGNQEPRAAIVLNVSNKIITIKYDKNYSGPSGPGTTCPNG